MKLHMIETTKIALEDEISRAIMAENGCTAHFEYKNEMGIDELPRIITVMTYNPKTKETFLLKEVISSSDEEGLIKISEYVKNHKVDYNSFTILWTKKGDTEQHISYFYCQDALEVLEKFFFDKQREDYLIYNLKMNPKS